MTADTFMADARRRYLDANRATLAWMLARPRIQDRYLDTKLNPLTLRNYGPADALRGRDYVYGWIQGRGLEALVTHAAAFETVDPAFARALDEAAHSLYGALDELRAADGHAYFCYGPDMVPARPDADGKAVPQRRTGEVYTYSDAFVAKGLVAAAARFAPGDVARHVAALSRIVEAIEDDRFQMAEKVPLDVETARAEPNDFGPRMILLGAAGMLARLDLGPAGAGATDYADRFISHIVSRHLDPESGLLRDVPGEDACNVGHAIEFVGFALDHLRAVPDPDPALVADLERVLVSSVDKGFVGPGIRLTVSAATGRPTSPYCPWWSLPETVRSAALAFERTGSPEAQRIWQAADARFFDTYWRETPPIAYQCLTPDGPLDYVPATPDLDPGYHTGLSLLAAADVAGRMASHARQAG